MSTECEFNAVERRIAKGTFTKLHA